MSAIKATIEVVAIVWLTHIAVGVVAFGLFGIAFLWG